MAEEKNMAEKIISAFVYSLREAMNEQRKLTENEFYAISQAFKVAKSELSTEYKVQLFKDMLFMIDIDAVREDEGNSMETFDQFVEEINT